MKLERAWISLPPSLPLSLPLPLPLSLSHAHIFDRYQHSSCSDVHIGDFSHQTARLHGRVPPDGHHHHYNAVSTLRPQLCMLTSSIKFLYTVFTCYGGTHNSPFYTFSLDDYHSHSTCRSELAQEFESIFFSLYRRYWVVLIVRAMGGESYSHSPFYLSYSKSWFCHGVPRALDSST